MLQKNNIFEKAVELFLLLLIAGLVLSLFTGCTSSGNNNNPNGPGGPGTHEVWIQGSAYNPDSITVSMGDTITWTNKDNLIHTVTSDAPGLFNSGNLITNSTFLHAFDSTGTFSYHCNFHANMHGVVIVNQAGSDTAYITMQNDQFNPPSRTITHGMTVLWTNMDNVAHTVTSGIPPNPNNLFSSGSLTFEQTYSYTFDSTGTFPYYCIFHQPAMVGTIIVQ